MRRFDTDLRVVILQLVRNQPVDIAGNAQDQG